MMSSSFKEKLDNIVYGDYCVLLVEDDEIMRLSLEDRLNLEGIPTHAVSYIDNARKELETGNIDLVVSDIRLPDGTGIELFDHISEHLPGTPVILMTAFGDVSDAVAVVKSGALDYLTKPFDINEFIIKVKRQLSRIGDYHLTMHSSGSIKTSFKPGSGYLGKSTAMRRIERLVARLGDNDSSVLITGESGVGKEVVANLVHDNSHRADRPMVKVNCAALSPSLIESELFGHEKGAFTGATQRHIGRFEQAHGGTIFLDEIAEVSPDIQVKLLRVLQEKEIDRVGSVKSVPIDVRVISATQILLTSALQNNSFRSDLYWRLNVIQIEIPPLRQRTEDIIYFARLFVNEFSKKSGGKIKGLSKEAELKLKSESFPGNIRELKNMMERAVALADGPWLKTSDLFTMVHEHSENSSTTLKESVKKAESIAIINALAENSGKINQAAETLGISRKNLWEKMKRYGIKR